jgi:hypothetical protein
MFARNALVKLSRDCDMARNVVNIRIILVVVVALLASAAIDER